MDLPILLGIIIGIIFVFLVLKIFTTILKAIFYTFLLLFIASIVLGFLVIRDVNNLKNNFANSSKIVLLIDNNQAITGFVAAENINPLTAEQLKEATTLYQAKDYEKLLGNNYKLFIMKYEALQNLSDVQFGIEGKQLQGGDILEVIKSDNPKTTYAALIEIAQTDIPAEVTDEEIKAKLFEYFFIYIFQRPVTMLKEYQKGNIYIYPETISFKVMKFSSLPFLEFFVKETISKEVS